jgi:TonB family protein
MALRVTADEDSLRLNWDRNSPLVRNAAAGIVWISDGNTQRRFDLRPADLTEGSVQYWPSSSEVSFKLELLVSQGQTEAVRASGVPATAPAVPEPPAQPQLARVRFEPLNPARRPGARPGLGPKPLHAVYPPEPAGPRNGEVVLYVNVDIDAHGKVTRADLVSRPSAATRDLENLALRTSRLWTFTPARSGDRRVAGKGVLRFTFSNVPADSQASLESTRYVQKP